MNYATQNHFGNNQHTRTATATEVAPTVRRVRWVDAKTKRRRPSAERQTEIRTDNNATNGFLKCTFLPKLKTANSVQACQKTERDFYQSLSKLAEHYSIEPMPTRQEYAFPYNIVLTMWDMNTRQKRTNINWDGFKLVQDSRKTYFVTDERFNTHTTLFYIPIIPLFKMLQDKQRKQSAQLLLSVCSYLYHFARIPYYRDENTYLYELYEMYKDWAEYGEAEESECNKKEIEQSEMIGDKMEWEISDRTNLDKFEQRLSQFNSRDTFDKECWQIACNAYALYTEYPNASIFRNAPIPEQDPYDDESIEYVGMKRYISFVADTKGWLFDSLVESINSDFNELGALEEPSITKVFDGKKITAGNLDFENRLFDILDDIKILLRNYKTVEQ